MITKEQWKQVKREALTKWDEGRKSGKTWREWWKNTGLMDCSFCDVFICLQTCPISDITRYCAKEWYACKMAYNNDIDNKNLQDFITNADLLYKRIKKLSYADLEEEDATKPWNFKHIKTLKPKIAVDE